METPDSNPQALQGESNPAVVEQPTGALAFRKRSVERKKPVSLKLSTGNIVQYVRTSVEGLIKTGIIPRDIAERILALQDEQGGKTRIKIDDLEITTKLQQTVLSKALVFPKLVIDAEPNYDNNEIAFDDLEDNEVQEIYNAALGVSNKDIEKFRS